MNRVQDADSNAANFMQNDCDNDHDLDRPQSTATTTFSGSMPGSVVAGSSRSRSSEPAARHAHSTSRRTSWPPGIEHDQHRHHDHHPLIDTDAAVDVAIAGVAGRGRAERGIAAAGGSSQQPAAAASSQQQAASSKQQAARSSNQRRAAAASSQASSQPAHWWTY